ncbi:MAG: hypothetical protein ACI9ZF_000295 [Bradyrhizobium sp.]|jgi:hypothetical protein
MHQVVASNVGELYFHRHFYEDGNISAEHSHRLLPQDDIITYQK